MVELKGFLPFHGQDKTRGITFSTLLKFKTLNRKGHKHRKTLCKISLNLKLRPRENLLHEKNHLAWYCLLFQYFLWKITPSAISYVPPHLPCFPNFSLHSSVFSRCWRHDAGLDILLFRDKLQDQAFIEMLRSPGISDIHNIAGKPRDIRCS